MEQSVYTQYAQYTQYDQVLEAIHSHKRFSSSASLERISGLLERLGNPQDALRCVHVTGTNGKGSVCALVESALRASGDRVGLFTSPYLVDFRERIQIDRQNIAKSELVACYETVMAAETELEREGFEPVNEFELVTALGFVAFSRARVDYAVMEVGLGGRFDATNVIRRPAVCCITPVSLDHTGILGDTVAQIAEEKAGIFKPGCPVVLAHQPPEAMAVLTARAEALGCPVSLSLAPERIAWDRRGQRFRYRGNDLFLPLLGRYQLDNAAAAWEVCRALGLESADVARGFAAVSWPGRLQYVEGAPALLIDAGHNPAGIEALCQTLDELFPNRRIVAVMAMMADKDYRRCIPPVARRSDVLIAATVGLPRSLPPEALAAEAGPYCPVKTALSVEDGLSVAHGLTKPEDLILVCGSVYAAGAALAGEQRVN